MSGTPQPAAETALRDEIAALRRQLEKALAESRRDTGSRLRRQLDDLREENRLQVKKRVRKSEGRGERSLRRLEKRLRQLERRVEEVEEARARAEWRIHADMAAMLDGHLATVRAIADRLEGFPARPD